MNTWNYLVCPRSKLISALRVLFTMSKTSLNNKILPSKFACKLALAFLFFGLMPSVAGQNAVIEEIRVRGNRRITLDDIMFYVQTKKGDPYDENRLRMDWMAINRTNVFEQIEMVVDDGLAGKIVTFIVREKRLIRGIKYEGNKSFSESDILEHFKTRKVGLTVDSQYEPGRIKAAERAIKELLEKNGKPLGSVRVEREDVPPNAVNVKFVVTEGEKVRVGQITFSGNKIYADDKIQSSMKMVRERNMITIFKGRDKYARLMLEADLDQNAKKLYQDNGYVKVAFGEPTVEIKEGPRGMIPMFRKTKRQFYIDVPVDAGAQYRVEELKVEINSTAEGEKSRALTDDQAAAFFGMRKGDVVNFTMIKDGMERLRKFYHERGFIAVEMLPNQRVDDDKKLFFLNFSVTPGDRYTVHNIDFAGNTKTRDVVLRREMLLVESEPYSGYLMDISVVKLNQLGFFDKIEEKDYDVTPNDRTKEVDITVRVKEKSQQSIGVTGGVSGISGSFIGLNYSTNNFLGRGERLDLDITGGTRTSNFVLSFTEPYLLGTRWHTGISLFSTKYRYDTYYTFGIVGYNGEPQQLFTRSSTGVTLSGSYPLGNYWRFGTSYTFQSIGITDIAEGYESWALGQLVGSVPGGDVSKANKGILRSEIIPSLTYNSTNAYYNPTRGQNLNLSFGFAGSVLGGDYNQLTLSADYRYFRPDRLISKGRNTWAVHLLSSYLTGFSGTPVPFYDRFFIGGETTIRGFDIRSIYPLAVSRTPKFDALGNPVINVNNTGSQQVDFGPAAVGGDFYGIGNFEYRIPVAGPLSLSPFVDLGTVSVFKEDQLKVYGPGTSIVLLPSTNNVLRSSVGLELQFLLPVVQAPFRLIFAYNPNRLNQFVNYGQGLVLMREPKSDIKFTIGRSF
jgi:outer membrane protein insertion porin family